MSGPNDWMQFYHQNFSTPAPASPGQAGPAANVFSASGVTTTPVANTAGRLSPEGGVSRPARRGPRASRRTPVTVMNTDAANFRAMVQHFTGGPSITSAPEPGHGGLSFGFELGTAPDGNTNPIAPFGSFQQQQRFHPNQLYGMVNNDPSFLRGTNMEGSQAHHGVGPSSSSSNDRSKNNTYNIFSLCRNRAIGDS